MNSPSISSSGQSTHIPSREWMTSNKIGIALAAIGALAAVYALVSLLTPLPLSHQGQWTLLGGTAFLGTGAVLFTRNSENAVKYAIALVVIGALGLLLGGLGYFNVIPKMGEVAGEIIGLGGGIALGAGFALAATRSKEGDFEEDFESVHSETEDHDIISTPQNPQNVRYCIFDNDENDDTLLIPQGELPPAGYTDSGRKESGFVPKGRKDPLRTPAFYTYRGKQYYTGNPNSLPAGAVQTHS